MRARCSGESYDSGKQRRCHAPERAPDRVCRGGGSPQPASSASACARSVTHLALRPHRVMLVAAHRMEAPKNGLPPAARCTGRRSARMCRWRRGRRTGQRRFCRRLPANHRHRASPVGGSVGPRCTRSAPRARRRSHRPMGHGPAILRRRRDQPARIAQRSAAGELRQQDRMARSRRDAGGLRSREGHGAR